MTINELHSKLAEKDWLIEDLTEVDFLLIAHVKEIMEEQLTIGGVSKSFYCGAEAVNDPCCKKQCYDCSDEEIEMD